MQPLSFQGNDTKPYFTIEKTNRRGVSTTKYLFVPHVTLISPGRKVSLAWRVCHPYQKKHAKPGDRQYQVQPILRGLSDDIPEDAFCVIAVTMEDLYEGPDDEFVVGMARCVLVDDK
jgi:hypothetical protein